jgi:DNA-binding NarL/FixJ family response regulator
LVEDHEPVRRHVIALLEQAVETTVVGSAASLRQAKTALPAAHAHIAILDVRLPDGSGLEYCRELHSTHPDISCIMFTSHDDEAAMLAAAIAGAAGYVLKDMAASSALMAAIQDVAAGKRLLDTYRQAAWRALETASAREGPLGPLTAQETAVRDLLLQGHSNAEITNMLQVKESTVRADLASLLAKTLSVPPEPARVGFSRRRRRRGADLE